MRTPGAWEDVADDPPLDSPSPMPTAAPAATAAMMPIVVAETPAAAATLVCEIFPLTGWMPVDMMRTT